MEWQWHPQRLFSRGELRRTVQGLMHRGRPTKREGCGSDLLPFRAPHELIKGVQREVAYWGQPGETAESGECMQHSALGVLTGNWAPVIIVAHTEPPPLWNPTD